MSPFHNCHYTRACFEYQDFIEQGRLLTTTLLTRGYQRYKMVSNWVEEFCGRHHDLVSHYNVAVSRLMSDVVAKAKPQTDFLSHGHYYSNIFLKLSVQTDREKRIYQIMLTCHGRLIKPHLFWVQIFLSEHYLFYLYF